MIVVKDGRAYFHQFNSREGAWEYVIAPEKYQQIDEVIRKWGNPVDVVAPTERVVILNMLTLNQHSMRLFAGSFLEISGSV